MTQWQKVKIGDFLTQRKERIVIDSNTEYSLVTISNKGVIKLRGKKKGAVISAKTGYVVKTGDFIYSRLSVHTGAFGIVPIELNNALITNEMPCFKINKSKIFPTILIKMISLPNFIWQLNQLTQGVGRVRIKESMMLSLSLMLPSIEEQKIIVKKLKGIESEENDLKQEISQQQTWLKKLRQQILQEAIEGKLTKDWRAENPNTEPAKELLKRIQAEKQQLIKDKKIKAQKPLPAISEDEKPFELPDSWAWCRLGNICNKITDGTHHSPSNTVSGDFKYITAKDIKYDGVNLSKITYVSKINHNEIYSRCNPEYGDLLLIKDGATTGVSTLNNLHEPYSMLSSVALLKISSLLVEKYILQGIRSKYFYKTMRKGMSGVAITRITLKKINYFIIPLPPLAEQKAIVTKVEKLLGICDKLETQITTNQTHAAQLMQAVLKEAFTQSEQPIKLTA